jgi:O-antigen ligase
MAADTKGPVDMTRHRASAPDRGGRGRLLLRLQATLVGLLCFSAGAVPRLLPALLGVLALVAAIHVFTVDPKRPLMLLRTAFGIALAVFIAYLFINATWAPDREAGLAKAATVLGLAVGAFLIAASYALRTGDEARVLAISALAGLMLGAAFLLIEIIFDEPIVRFVSNHIVQLFEITPKKMKIEHGEVAKISAFVLNRNVTSLVLLLVPGLLFTLALAASRRRTGFAALLAITAISVLLSQSGTSVMAFFVGALVLGLAARSRKATRMLLVTGWTIAVLLAVPLGALPYGFGWQHWKWLPPESVAARFYIWKYVADKIHETPIAGIGIRATRDLHLTIPADAGDPTETEGPLRGREARHPHNIFLQTWLELGAIGAILLLGVGLTGLWAIRAWPPILETSGYTLFAVCCVIGVSGFDLWQTWLLAALAIAWAAMLLAARFPALARPTTVGASPLRPAGKAALPATIA